MARRAFEDHQENATDRGTPEGAVALADLSSGPTNPADCHDRFEPLRTFEVLVERNKCPAGDHSPPSDMMVAVRHLGVR